MSNDGTSRTVSISAGQILKLARLINGLSAIDLAKLIKQKADLITRIELDLEGELTESERMAWHEALGLDSWPITRTFEERAWNALVEYQKLVHYLGRVPVTRNARWVYVAVGIGFLNAAPPASVKEG